MDVKHGAGMKMEHNINSVIMDAGLREKLAGNHFAQDFLKPEIQQSFKNALQRLFSLNKRGHANTVLQTPEQSAWYQQMGQRLQDETHWLQ